EHDLRAFLHGRAITAQAPGMVARGAAFAARHRRGILVAAATTVVLSLAGVAAGVWRDTRAHEDGLRALATAAEELVERGDLEQAQAAYGRASQLLRDGAAVDAARAHHAVLAFDRWYPDAARRDWLQRLLASVPVPARDAAWHERHRRWQGVARCTLHGHLLDGDSMARPRSACCGSGTRARRPRPGRRTACSTRGTTWSRSSGSDSRPRTSRSKANATARSRSRSRSSTSRTCARVKCWLRRPGHRSAPSPCRAPS